MNEPFRISIHKPNYLEILDYQRKKIFPKLSFTSKNQIYLAGGTALAFYLNHRTSVDFDFYTREHFSKQINLAEFVEEFKDEKVKVERDIDDTFYLSVNDISISCFYYRYPLIANLNEFHGVKIASLEDIAAMKCISVFQRGTFRDFVDIYYLLKIFGLKQLLAFSSQKYPEYDEQGILKGLIFFNDADVKKTADLRRIEIFDRKFNWDNAKKYIIDNVIAHQRNSH